jgi:rhomboid protease GluP
MDDRRSALSPHVPLERLRAWRRAEHRLEVYVSLRPTLTVALLASLVFVHVVTGLAGGGDVWARIFGMRSEAVMLRFGAREGRHVIHGEVWRLLASGFLHWDVTHLFMNGLALWGLGRLCEAVFGPVRFLWLFLMSVLGGALLSQTGALQVVSAGASGGIFGLLGGLAVFGLRRRDALSPGLREMFGKRLWPWIALNLGIGIALPFIDNRAHVGGLVAGAVCGGLLGDRITDNGQGSRRATITLAVASAMLLVVTAATMIRSAIG